MAFAPAASMSCAQGIAADQRHVAVQHQHQFVVGDIGHGLHDRVAGAELFGLQRPLQIFFGERGAYRVAAVAVHHVDGGGFERARPANNVPEQRHAGERLQNLGQIGLHSLALTGSEDHDGEFHEPASLSGLDGNEQLLTRSQPGGQRDSAAELPAGRVVGIVAAGIEGREIVLAEQRVHDIAPGLGEFTRLRLCATGWGRRPRLRG